MIKYLMVSTLLLTSAWSADVFVVTSYGKTGGIVGDLNDVGDKVNGRDICPANPTKGCDFSDNPGFNIGAIDNQTDDTYTGDILVRTNDIFEAVAGWTWNGTPGGAEEEVTITGQLPVAADGNSYYEYTQLPGGCAAGSSISADKQTIVCVRKDFDANDAGTYAEDLKFPVRVRGNAPDAETPGNIAFTVTEPTGETNTDVTETSLVVTASPRWNLDKGRYTNYAGRTYDIGDGNGPVTGFIIDYNFQIEADEVNGEVDDANPVLGNESMGDDATFNFTDSFANLPPNATVIGCSMNGRYDNRDGYNGGSLPISYSGAGSIRNSPAFDNRHIQVGKDDQTISCVQTAPGQDVAIEVQHVDASLKTYPTYSYTGTKLPVNRAIASIGNIYVFVPLSDVELGKDGIAGTADDGEYAVKNTLTGFDPTTPTGNSNFAGNVESEKDNHDWTTLYGARGNYDKYFRGTQNPSNYTYPTVWGYVGSGYRSGDGMVNGGSEFSTILHSNNTGGTDFAEDTFCDVVDAYRLKIQATQDNTVYNVIKNYTAGDPATPFRYYVVGDKGAYTDRNAAGGYEHDAANSPYIAEYATTYVDDSFLPSKGGSTGITTADAQNNADHVHAECTDPSVVWTTDFAAAAAGPIGVTKVRFRLRPGVVHPPGSYVYMWLNHEIRTTDLATNQPMVNNDIITNFASHKFSGGQWTAQSGRDSYFRPGQFPGTHAGREGDRVIYTGAKVRIIKKSDISAAALGDEITYTIQSSYTNDTGLAGEGNVTIIDILPKAFAYKTGSVVNGDNLGSGITFGEPTIGTCQDAIDAGANMQRGCVDGENEVLIWNMGTTAINAEIPDLSYTALIGASANQGTSFNTATATANTDVSPLSQRTSEASVVINVPSSLIVVKTAVDNPDYPELRERVTVFKELFFNIDVRSGNDGNVTDVDMIDILPFFGDADAGALLFRGKQNIKRRAATEYHGEMRFSGVSFAESPNSAHACNADDVKYYYSHETPSDIDLAPTVGAPNVIGSANSVWCEGTQAGPNGCTTGAGFTFPAGATGREAVTAVRVKGAEMEPQAICSMLLKIEVKNNLKGDNYSNSAGASAIGITNPVLSNAPAIAVAGSSLGNYVWYDANKDGIQDANEKGIAGVTVKLLDAFGVPVNDPVTGIPYILVTDENGSYLFDNLVEANYTVEFVPPTGYITSPKGAGGDAETDANIGTGNNISDVIILAKAANDFTIDAGFYTPVISGSIFNDGDGDVNVNGAAIPTPDGEQLYATLLAADGTVLATVPIDANGTYSFNGDDGVRTSTNYSVVISTEQNATTSKLPNNWNNSGEQTNNAGAGKDATEDGIIAVSVGSVDVPNNDFGINKAPVTADVNETSRPNPGGTTQVSVPDLNVSDFEEGTTPNTITITTLPTNATLYYNGNPVAVNTPIPNFDQNLLTVDPDSGDQNVTFAYTSTDKDNVASNESTVTMPFFVVLPKAEDDNKSNPLPATPSNPTTLNVLDNDTNGTYQLDPTTVRFKDNNGTTLTVAGEGTWTVDNTGNVTFTPQAGFTGDPTPVDYTVEDTEGNEVGATITVDYPQTAPVTTDNNVTGTVTNTSSGPVQQPVTFNAITDDDGNGTDSDPENDLNTSSFVFTSGLPGSAISPDGKTITVPNEGTWTEDGAGNVTFTPDAGFLGNPTPVKYEISDNTGLVSNISTLSVNYPEVRKISGNVGIDITDDNVTDRVPLVPVEMILYDVNGTEVARTMTDANGDYSFDVAPGIYGVEEINPPNVENAIDIDSNVTDDGLPDGTNDSNITLIDATTQDSPNNDFVDKPVLGNVKGTVFKDTNSNDTFEGSEGIIPNISIVVTDVYGVEHNLTTDENGTYDLTGLPVGPATVVVASDDPDLPEGSNPTYGIPTSVDIPANDYAIKDFGFNIPPVLDSDPADLAQCAKPSSITWEGATVSSASVWHGADMIAPQTFVTVGDKAVNVTFTLTDTDGQFNYDDNSASTAHAGTDDNGSNKAAFGQPYLTLYLGKQDDNTTADLPAGASATLTVDFDDEVLLDNWRIRDLDSGNLRGGNTGWDWQDAIKMTAFDAAGNEVPLTHTEGSTTNLVTDANGFLHTDGVGTPAELTGGGTDQDSPDGHVVYSSNGLPIKQIVIVHAAGPDIANQTRSALALSGFAVCVPLHISGTIYNDGNGSTVDGNPIGDINGTKLYANLVDSTGKVVDTVEINATTGEYLFDKHINKDANYTVVLSIDEMTVGDPQVAPVLPANWNYSSENNTSTAPDGLLNGIIQVEVADESVPLVDFGINEKPVATDVVDPPVLNPGGDLGVPIQNASAATVTDREDGTPTTLTLKTLPANATILYDGNPVVPGTAIEDFNLSKLTVNPIDGNQTVVFDYTTTDADGVESDPATITMPFVEVILSGNVFNDGNGDGNVSGAAISAPDGTQLYATLLDDAGVVLASTAIAIDGSYSFDGADGVAPDQNYSVVLSTEENATTSTLPTNWNNTGQNLNDTNATGNDGSPIDGKINVSMTGLSVANPEVPLVDFGINLKPIANDTNETTQLNPGKDKNATVPTLSVTDSEDTVPTTITIKTLPDNATLYYNGTAVTAGQVIPNYNPALLTVDPDNGDQVVTFDYTTTDADGVESDPATVTMPFTGLVISGNVFNDGNGDGDVNGTAINEPNATPLYATLLDNTGAVLATTPIAADGSYSFDGEDGVAPNTNYSVVVSTEENATTSTLPANWNNSGENDNNASDTGNDGTDDGILAVTVGTSDVPAQDFGINLKPTAQDANETSQLNPGGDTQVVVPDLNVTDLEDGTPTTITIETLPDNATLYYNGVEITDINHSIEDFNASLLTVDPIDGEQLVDFNYTTTDADGVKSDPATVTMPFTGLVLSGNVFNDGNGDEDVSGDAISAPDGTQLYATLLAEDGITVLATTPVDENGSYSFDVTANTTYSVVIAKDENATTSILPDNWNNTGENLNDTGAGNDGTDDGVITISMAIEDVPLVDFGINKKPLAEDKSEPAQINLVPGATVVVPGLNITDDEDGNTTTITIKTLPDPTQGILEYNGTAVTAGQVIPNFDPTLLTVDPADAAQGVDAPTVVFTYTTTDADGIESDPATVTMPFTAPTVSGNVFADGSGDDDVNGSAISAPSGTQLFVTLIDKDTGTVVASQAVNADGTYYFNVNNGVVFDRNYTLVLTDELNKTTAALPTDWNNADGENVNSETNGTGNDGQNANGEGDGSIDITGPTAVMLNVTLVDFGINHKPTATNVYKPTQLNPGADVQVPAPELTGTDDEDGIPTTVTITTLPDNATLYYNGTEITDANFTIVDFNASLLTVDPINGDQEVKFDYTITDAAGVESKPATATMAFTGLIISGNVFNDGNGDDDVNGTAISKPDGVQLYATLLAEDGTTVLATTPIDENGTYSFNGEDGIVPNTNYSVVISIDENATTSTLPINWNNTGENDNDASSTGNDGDKNGVLLVGVGTSDVPLQDFGINLKPTAADVNETIQLNPGGDTAVVVAELNITDNEDGSPSTITIKTLPTNAILEYNGTAVTVGQVIPNFDPTLLTVNPDNGDQYVTFDYTTTDAEGIESNVATVTMTFTNLTISGSVFNDGNGDDDVNGTSIARPDGVQLYATLLAEDGITVLSTTPIDENGTYSFDNADGVVPNTNYSVVISIDENATTSTLPANWNNTGENDNNASSTGNDGDKNGILEVVVGINNVPLQDFGINLKPVAVDVNEATQLNPGGNIQVTVPDLNITDSEDVTPAILTIETVPDNATLYYDGVVIQAGDVITDYNASLLGVDPINGDQNVTFTYTTTDNAGVKSDPATVMMIFTGLEISGSVLYDANGDDSVDGNSTSTADVPLYVTLLDEGGNILATTLIAEDGSYGFDGEDGIAPNTDYTVVLSTEPNATEANLPENWYNTGEEQNNTAQGNDGNNDGMLTVNVTTEDVSNNDLGITLKPTTTDDIRVGERGVAVTIDIMTNDSGENDLNKSSVRIIDDNGQSVTTLEVPGEGTWDVNTTTGEITFTPIKGFTDNPTPIDYTVADSGGAVSNPSKVIIQYIEFDPTGYFYCEDDGRIIPGGGITVTGPLGSNSAVGKAGGVEILEDGSDGNYQWIALTSGEYNVTYNYPTINGVLPSTRHLVSTTVADVTTLTDINTGNTGVGIGEVLIGSLGPDSNGLLDTAEYDYYDRFIFEAGDPFVKGNNVPMTNCASVVAFDDYAPIDHYGPTDITKHLRGEGVGTLSYTILDENGNPIPVGVPYKTENGTVVVESDGRVYYSPDPDKNNVTDRFDYRVTDKSTGLTDDATVTLDIQCGSSQTSDGGDALSTTSMLFMMFLTMMAGLYAIRREEKRGER